MINEKKHLAVTALLGVFLSACAPEDPFVATVRVQVPVPKKNKFFEELFFMDGPEALADCPMPNFRAKVRGPGLSPPIVSENIVANFYPGGAPGMNNVGAIELQVPKGEDRYVDIKGLAYDSNCSFSAQPYQTIIVFGSVGPLSITGAVSVTVPVVITSVYTTVSIATATPIASISSFSQVHYPPPLAPNIVCNYPHTFSLQDLDLNLPIKYHGSGTMINPPSVYIGPVFPHSHYEVDMICNSAPVSYPLDAYANAAGAGSIATVVDH